MKKQNLYMSATLLCGLLALALSIDNGSITLLWPDNKPVAVVLGLLSVIFATQWIKYQRRHDKNATRLSWLQVAGFGLVYTLLLMVAFRFMIYWGGSRLSIS